MDETVSDEIFVGYDRCRQNAPVRGLVYPSSDKVADVIREKFPERVPDIWEEQAERSAAQGHPLNKIAVLFNLALLLDNDMPQDLFGDHTNYQLVELIKGSHW
jgi:hypothetical protein